MLGWCKLPEVHEYRPIYLDRIFTLVQVVLMDIPLLTDIYWGIGLGMDRLEINRLDKKTTLR